MNHPSLRRNTKSQETSTRDLTNEPAVFAFAIPAGCSILSCINVIGEAVCIADAIEQEDWKNIFKCAKKKEVSHSYRFSPLPIGLS